METADAINDALAELVTAFRTDVDEPQARLYRRLLGGVPAEVITESADRLMVEPGRRFLPTPAEWITVCADVVDERRTAAARLAATLTDACPACDPKGWVTVTVDGVERLSRCHCWTNGQTLIAQAGVAIRRPALPAASESEPVA